MDTLVYKEFRSEIKELGVGGIWRGRICDLVNFLAVKISKEKVVGALYDEFSKGT